MSSYKSEMRVKYVPLSFSEEDLTIECVYATETPVDRGDFDEILVVSKDAIDSRRLDSGAVNLIWNHDWDQSRIVGRVVEHRVENGQAIATIKLSASQYSQGTIQDIKDGIIRNVSVGYDVLDYETEKSNNAGGKVIRRVKRWMPFEVSIVGIPADHNAKFRSKNMNEDINAITEDKIEDNAEAVDALDEAQQKIDEALSALVDVLEAVDADETTVEEYRSKAERIARMAKRSIDVTDDESEVEQVVVDAIEALAEISAELTVTDDEEVADEIVADEGVRAERARIASITSMCRTHKVSSADMDKMITKGISVKGARQMIKNLKASGAARGLNTSRATVIRDAAETRYKGVRDALYARLSGKPVSNLGRQYRGMSMKEIAREFIGPSSRMMNESQLFSAVTRNFGPHTSADLGLTGALGEAMNTRLREAYAEGDREYEAIVRRTTVRNFLPQAVIGAGSFPAFRHIPEGAEIEFGTAVGDSGTFQIQKRGRAVAFTFEAFTNDDIRYIDSFLNGVSRAARLDEEALVFGALTDNALRADGLPTFDVSRGNVISEALDLQGLAIANAALRRQKDVDGTPLGLKGSVLIVSPDNELAAYKLTTPIVAADSSLVNPYAGQIKAVVVDDRIGGDDWYLTAGLDGDTVELASLEGHEGVQVEEQWNPVISATAFYAKAYAGATLTGWRGLVKSVGANEVEG